MTQEEGPAAARALAPSSALSFTEAAALAGVEPERIAALAESGELLHEGSRDRRRDDRVVRLVDLADVFPHVLGRGGPSAADESRSGVAGDAALQEVDVPRPDLAEEVLASGASRDALVGLAQDLEARLDLAERERQASTASLLMAQRRVLDLELKLRRRPWSRAGAAAATALSCVALAALVRLPELVRQTAAEELGAARLETMDELRALKGSTEAALAAAAREREAAGERTEEAIAAAVASAAAIASEARDARLAVEERAAADAARAEGERGELQAALAGLESRLRAADERGQRRAAERAGARAAARRARLRPGPRRAGAARAAAAARG
ncbi:MAG: hypothetical protein VX460_14700, partial [Planctomycetota bacterium]|nr:hypothetical protein [Planctomycetota bacterium]